MKKLLTLIFILCSAYRLQAQNFPPGFCYSDAFQLEIIGPSVINSCNDSALLEVSLNGNAVVFWSDGQSGNSIWVTISGIYFAYAYDSLGCLDTTAAVEVNVYNAFPWAYSLNFSNNFCEGSTATLNASATGSVVWNTGDSTFTINVTDPGDYFFTVTDFNGCTSVSNTVTLQQIPLPPITVNVIGDTILCLGQTVTLEASGANALSWNFGSFSNPLTTGGAGTYTAWGTDSTGQCQVVSDPVTITVLEPFNEFLCAVTVDTISGKNQLVWNETPNQRTVTYRVYRESNIAGQFTLLGDQPFGSGGTFIDQSSLPMQQPYSYYLATIDSCGNENTLAPFYVHTTLHLTSSLGVNGENNLNWSPYLGIFPLSSYEIQRSNGFGPFSVIATVSANITSFTDLNPPPGNNRYFVSLVSPSQCGSGSVAARSNMVSNQLASITEQGSAGWYILQNPSSGIFEWRGLSAVKGKVMTICDLQGRVVLRKLIQDDFESVDLSQAPAGMYLMQLDTYTQKLIKQ